ncbi:endo-1,4-beta-xylanase [bacterium]|nr:endo-1,4-beta-xylanase [bacterium]
MNTMAGGAGSLIFPHLAHSSRGPVSSGQTTGAGELVFRPFFVQRGRGPHLLDWTYLSDEQGDSFRSSVTASREGIRISDAAGKKRFAVNVRWNVEDFGYIYITADNGGACYELPASGKTAVLNLNFELAKSRVIRNRKRTDLHEKSGWKPSHATRGLLSISESYYRDAEKSLQDGEKSGGLSQQALLHAMRASEAIELEKAEWDIRRDGARPGFFTGCDARGYFQMDVERFLSLFPELFNYATITHYLVSGVFEDFEPEEGRKQFALRDALFRELLARGIPVEGRPLWWSYKTTTPDWLRRKSYDEVRRYVEKHVREVVGHYGEEMFAWEVVNEFHDWANECRLTPEQTIEVTRLACDTARSVAPKVKLLINNCAPFAEYVQLGKWTELDALYPQRTPHQFVRQLQEAGVEFDITGVQMYFPYRDLSDTILLIDRFTDIGKPVHLTEVGTSSGPSVDSIHSGKLGFPGEPYAWHRPWDEELQADWMQGLYTLAYSRKSIEAVNWYDFVDPHSWIPNGGFLRSPKCEKKAVWDRLLRLKENWTKGRS